MIPAAFDHAAPTTVDEAVDLLSRAGSDGQEVTVLGGGQSLIPVLRLRMAAPDLLVDLGRIEELRGIREEDGVLVIGAMVTHDRVTRDPLVRRHALLLALAAETIADPQVRHRGTFGGALAHADPAGDLPACALALGAQMVVAGPGGTRRTVPAEEFFVDLFTTAVGEDEVLVEVRVPLFTGWGADYRKLNRVAQAWSIVASAATVRLEDGVIAQARVGLTHMGPVPVRARAVEEALVGRPPTEDAVRAATRDAGAGTDPPEDVNADAPYRRHLAGVLTGRAVLAATGA